MKRFISFITSLRNIKRPQLILGGLLITTTTATTLMALPAYASWLGEKGAELTSSILIGLFTSLGNLIQWASVLFLSLIINVILPGQNSLIFGEQLHTAWRAMLDLTNIIFFLALFIFAIFIITRNASYNFKKAVTALITAIALANLSLVIVQLLIEMGDALRNFSSLIPAFGMQGGDTSQMHEWLHGLVLPKDFMGLGATPGDSWDKVWIAFEVMAAQAIIAYVLFRLMFVLVERAIRLAILAIFGPIQAAISVLPQKELQGLGGNWFGDVLRWVLVLPLSFILIGIARLIMPTNSAATIDMFLHQAQTDPGTLTGTGQLFLLIIGLGVLIAASSVPAMLKVPVSALTNMLPNYVGKAGRDFGKGIWNDVKARGKDVGFRVGRYIPDYRWAAGKIADRKQQVENQAKQRASFANKAARDRAVSRYNKNNQTLEGNIKIQLEQEPGAKEHGGFDAWLAADPEAAKAAKNRIKDRAEKTNLGLAVDADNKAYMAAIMDEVDSEAKKDRNAGELQKAIEEIIAKIKSNPNDNDAKMKLSAMLILLKRETNRSSGAGKYEAIKAFNDVIKDNELENNEIRSELGIHNKVNLNPIPGRNSASARTTPNQPTSEDYIKQATLNNRVEQLKQSTGNININIRNASEQVLKTISDEATRDALSTTRDGDLELADFNREKLEKIMNRTDLSPEQKETEINNIFVNAPAMRGIATALANGVGFDDLALTRNLAMESKNSNITTGQISNIVELRELQPKLDEAKQKIDSIPVTKAYAEIAKNIKNIEYGKSYDAKFVQDAIDRISSAIANNPSPNAKLGEMLDPDLLDQFSGFFDTSGVSTMNPGANLNSRKGVADMEFNKALDVFTQINKGLNT